jgi:hypothetical protein
MRPRIPKGKRREPDTEQDAPEYTHILYHSPKKRKRVAPAQPSIYVGNGARYVQKSNLPVLRGQVGLYERPRNWPAFSGTVIEPEPGTGTIEYAKTAASSISHRKRLAQNHRWENDVIPMLVKPYMTLQKETDNLQREPHPIEMQCICTAGARVLKVIVLRLNGTLSHTGFEN